ncbi:ATP synthase F1 subunit epsilon [bacterium]|nr:ATP synthase F1 subunit epsilon [bacterium]
MHLKIITHEKIVFDNEVDEIYTRGLDGEFGILKSHEPVTCPLGIGVTRVSTGGKTEQFTTMGGIFQFKDENAVILTDSAENSNDIDVERAKLAKQRAELRLAEKKAETDIKRAEAALARALARLKVAIKE